MAKKPRNRRKPAKAAAKVSREEAAYVGGLVVVGLLLGFLWVLLARL